MTDERDLRDLVGEDVSERELEDIRRADAVLRSVPPPPANVPESLTRAVTRIAEPRERLWTARRGAAALAFAAALSALFFVLGLQAGGDEFDERAAIPMEASADARGAEALIRVGEPDESGNWPLRLEASGLPKLPEGGYYLLWLAKDGEFGVACGSFAAGKDETEAEWTVSYRLRDYDTWVVTAYLPEEPRDTKRPWLLQAEVSL